RLREAAGDTALRLRHCDWVADFVAEIDVLPGAQQRRWLDLIEREQDNLRAALEFCLRQPTSAHVGLLMAARCWLHWSAGGHLGEARRWLTALLEAAPDASLARARALATLAMVALSAGDTRTADVALDEGAQLSRRMELEEEIPFLTLLSGVSAYMQADFG